MSGSALQERRRLAGRSKKDREAIEKAQLPIGQIANGLWI
jgi:hypothetical protein